MDCKSNNYIFQIEDIPTPDGTSTLNSTPIKSKSSTFGIPLVLDPTTMVKLSTAAHNFRFSKWAFVMLILMQMIFLIPQAYLLLSTVILLIIGLIGIFKKSSFFLYFCAIYILILIATQGMVMIYFREHFYYIIFQGVFIFLEIMFFWGFLFAGSSISNLNSEELQYFKAYC